MICKKCGRVVKIKGYHGVRPALTEPWYTVKYGWTREEFREACKRY